MSEKLADKLDGMLEKVELLQGKIVLAENNIKNLVKQLLERDELILKLKEYVGEDNFRAILALFKQDELKKFQDELKADWEVKAK